MATKFTTAKVRKAHVALTEVVQADDILEHMSPTGVAYLAVARKTLVAYLQDEVPTYPKDDDGDS